jgi:hypothetical protein
MKKYLLLGLLFVSGIAYSQMTFYVAPSRGGGGGGTGSSADHGGAWDIDDSGDVQSSGIWMYDSNGDSQPLAKPMGTEGYWVVNLEGDITVTPLTDLTNYWMLDGDGDLTEVPL